MTVSLPLNNLAGHTAVVTLILFYHCSFLIHYLKTLIFPLTIPETSVFIYLHHLLPKPLSISLSTDIISSKCFFYNSTHSTLADLLAHCCFYPSSRHNNVINFQLQMKFTVLSVKPIVQLIVSLSTPILYIAPNMFLLHSLLEFHFYTFL